MRPTDNIPDPTGGGGTSAGDATADSASVRNVVQNLGARVGFRGREYEKLRGDLRNYDDRFEAYWGFPEPRLLQAWRLRAADGTLSVHLASPEAHIAKIGGGPCRDRGARTG